MLGGRACSPRASPYLQPLSDQKCTKCQPPCLQLLLCIPSLHVSESRGWVHPAGHFQRVPVRVPPPRPPLPRAPCGALQWRGRGGGREQERGRRRWRRDGAPLRLRGGLPHDGAGSRGRAVHAVAQRGFRAARAVGWVSGRNGTARILGVGLTSKTATAWLVTPRVCERVLPCMHLLQLVSYGDHPARRKSKLVGEMYRMYI